MFSLCFFKICNRADGLQCIQKQFFGVKFDLKYLSLIDLPLKFLSPNFVV